MSKFDIVLSGIYVECRGFARVSFSTMEQRSRTIRRRGRSHVEISNASVNHTSSEEYFYHRVTLKDGGKIQIFKILFYYVFSAFIKLLIF